MTTKSKAVPKAKCRARSPIGWLAYAGHIGVIGCLMNFAILGSAIWAILAVTVEGWQPQYLTLAATLLASVVAINVATYAAWRADLRELANRNERAARAAAIVEQYVDPIYRDIARMNRGWRAREGRLIVRRIRQYTAPDVRVAVEAILAEGSKFPPNYYPLYEQDVLEDVMTSIDHALEVLDQKVLLELGPDAARKVAAARTEIVEFKKVWRGVHRDETLVDSPHFDAEYLLHRTLAKTGAAIHNAAKVIGFQWMPSPDLIYSLEAPPPYGELDRVDIEVNLRCLLGTDPAVIAAMPILCELADLAESEISM